MTKISRKARKLRKQSWDNGKRARKIFDIVNILLIIAIVIVLILLLFSCHSQEGDGLPSETATADTTEVTDSEMSSLVEKEEESAEESETSEPVSETESETVSETEISETTEESRMEQTSSSASSVTTAKPQKKPTSQTQKIKVTVTIKNIISVYGDEFKALDYEISAGNITKSELSKYITLTKQGGKNAGQYWITGTCNAPNLFDVTFVPGVYTIIPRPVTLQAEDKQSFVGEALKKLTYNTVSGSIINGDKVVYLSTKADPAKVGTYDIVGKCINSNYNLTVEIGKYTVKEKGSSSSSETKPVDVTVKILNKSSYYGDKISELDFSISKGNVKKSELSKYITLTKAAGNSVGDYEITGKCKDTGGKYNVTFEKGTYTIKARKLSVKVDNKESFVGETLATLTYSVKSGSVVSGDKCIELSTNADSAKTGTYDIVGRCVNSNYEATIEKGVYTVKEKPVEKVTVQIGNVTVTYGESAEPDFSVISGNVTKEEIAPYITLTKEGNNNVGTHKITGTCSDTSKYNVTFIEGTYTITQRIIVVKADDKMTYEGEALAELTYMLTAGSIVAGDNVISLATTATPTAVGEYPITIRCLNSNYVLQAENGTYRVKAKPQPPKDDEEEVEGDTSSSSPSESEEGPKDEEEDVKPSQPTPSEPVDGSSEEDVEPNKPTPSEPSDETGADRVPPSEGPVEESEEVRPGTPTP